MDPKTGFIVSKTVLDREMLINEFGSNSVTFEVVVSDDGLPKLSDSATVTITVNDENDNSPTFSKVRHKLFSTGNAYSSLRI